MGSLQLDKEGAAQRERISRSKVPSHWLGPRMNTASPTILRTRHKFGDYLSQPDLAKFELPKKMSRPWIVNNAFEQEKLKDLIVTERPVEASLVMRQIKESKQERNKWGLAAPVHKMTQQRPCPTTWLPRTTWRETRKTHNLLKRTSNWSSKG